MITNIFIVVFFIIFSGSLLFLILKKKDRYKLILPIFFVGTLGFFVLADFANDGYLAQLLFPKKIAEMKDKEQANNYAQDDDVNIVKIEKNVLLDAPIINQFPELPRGCEVTSLAMLLQHINIDVDKMTLAKEIKKDPTPYSSKNGAIQFGHPNIGFVGNMYTYEKHGLGVYHKPIKDLAEQYAPGRIIDLTGSAFDELKIYLSDDRPVWVIINTMYDHLPKNYFQTWQTPAGEIEITYKEHSVLITGYDNEYIYFNDPLIGKKNRQESIEGFKKAWIQMGRQAITYLP